MQDKIYIDLLDEYGLSNTKSRRLVFHLLASSHRPLTLSEIVKQTSSSINKSTVYRTIESFEEAGIVKSINIGWKQSYELSDKFNHHHHHMTCSECGKVTPFEESYKLLAELERIEEAYRFVIEDHTIELRGLCHQCQMHTN